MKNTITDRIYLSMQIQLESPLCVASGETLLTDHDIIRDFDGKPFIPGTTIAGAMRSYLEGGDSRILFGYSENEQSRMSSIYISDVQLKNIEGNDVSTQTRDGVSLKNKIAVTNKKYEMEVVDTGAVGMLYLEFIIREKNSLTIDELKEQIKKIIFGLVSGEIRFGHRKNRGYGTIKVLNVWSHHFVVGKHSVEDWIEFNPKDVNDYRKSYGIKEINRILDENIKRKYIELNVPLKLTGGISIRQYQAKKGHPDYKHITSNQMPVIPGTSWCGAIRNGAERILKELGFREIQVELENLFGNINEGAAEAKESKLIVSESCCHDSRQIKITRNKIDRFTNASVQGALYTEEMYVGGNLYLNMKVQDLEDYKWVVGLLLLIIQDIQNGYIPIGGETAIGHGIMDKGDEEIYISKGTADEYMRSLEQKCV